MNIRISWLVLCFSLAAVSASGQETYLSTRETLEKQFENHLTWSIQSALSDYFPERTFVVKADVRLVPVVPKRELPPLADPLPDQEITRLPGLPVMPDDNTGTQNQMEERRRMLSRLQESRLSVKWVRVQVLVDEQLGEEEVRFLRRLVALTADLDPGRGDRVRIERMRFPGPLEPEVQQEESAPDVPVSPPPEPETQKAAPFWLPFWFMAGLALMLLALFLFGLNKISRQLAGMIRAPSAPGQSENGSRPAVRHGIHEHADHDRQEEEKKQALRSGVIESLVGTPASSARVLSQWIHQEGEIGHKKVAVLLASTSRSLIDLVGPYLGPEDAARVQLQMDRLEQEDLEALEWRVLNQFDHDLRQMALRARKEYEGEDALAFLYKMTDDQLLHLIKPLKKGVKAIVLAQLRPDRAAKLLQAFDAEARKEILAAMGNIEKIPADVYQHIARQLAARARELQNMRFVRADGIESLVDVLEQMDEKTQDETLQFLATQDVELAEKVRRRFLSFQDILQLPGEELRELAVHVDRELLARSLVKVDEKATNRILNALPDRLAEMVRASLETLDDVPEEEVARARREVLRKAREVHLKKMQG